MILIFLMASCGLKAGEILTARRKAAEALTQWRLSVPMSKYKAFRKMYENAGVKIYAFKKGRKTFRPDNCPEH
jgi:hypothetical protein